MTENIEIIEIIRSDRKTIEIIIKDDGRVVVRAPLRMKSAEINRLVSERSEWIETHLELVRRRRQSCAPALTQEELRKLATAAGKDLSGRTEKYAQLVGVTYGRITIRSQRTRWGSCSAKGNLNYNCLLMLCPEEIRDYVVVHELCHRIEMNHSRRFWAEVERILPDYQARRKWLRTYGGEIIGRLG